MNSIMGEMMKKIFAIATLALLLAGCASVGGSANGGPSVADALEACGQEAVILTDPANLAPEISKLGASNGVVVNGTYLFLGLKTKWNKSGLGNVALACVSNELKITSATVAAIKADAEEQKSKAKAFASRSVDLAGDAKALKARKASLLAKAEANGNWNSQLASYTSSLRGRYAGQCSDPNVWPGDTYLCGNNEDFSYWISMEGCKNPSFCSSDGTYYHLAGKKSDLQKEVALLDAAINNAESDKSFEAKMESALGLKFVPIGSGLSQSWLFTDAGHLVLVLKAS